MKKKLALLISLIIAVFAVSSVSVSASQYSEENNAKYIEIAQYYASIFPSISQEDYDSIKESGQIDEVMMTAGDSWYSIAEQLGTYQSLGEATVELQGSDVVVTTPLICSENTGYFICTFDGEIPMDTLYQSGETKSMVYSLTPSLNAEDSTGLGTKMKNASLNTLMGMGTVFLVLVFISLIIYLLGFVPKLFEKEKKEEKPQPAVPGPTPGLAPQTATVSNQDALVAVITAAVAAAMSEETNTAVTTDQLIVRSIKRTSNR
ncbi:MAG: OadG family protein [Lachnospiraceae bacterium]